MSTFVTLSQKEINEFVNSAGKTKEPYKMVGHTWKPLKHVGKSYCTRCGIVALNNEFTQWCIDRGCNHEDHPQYENARSRLTKPSWEKN
jgi:hypothetical protein